jgi:hypothetical protein
MSRRSTPAPSKKKTNSASVLAVPALPSASTTAVTTRRRRAATIGYRASNPAHTE